MVRYTLRQCRYFRAVAEHGGIAPAARALSISQPSVAQAIAKLEEVTGLTLFERHHARGLVLTFQGRQFLESVARLEKEAERAEQDATALAGGLSGRLRLGLFWTLAPFFGPALVRRLAHTHPRIGLAPVEMSLADLGDALREGAIDAAITYDQGGDLRDTEVVPLFPLRPTVIVASSHPLAARTTVAPADLRALPYVMFEGAGSRAYFDALLSRLGIEPVIAYASASMETVRSAVANGLGWSIFAIHPATTVTYEGLPLKILPIDGDVPPIRVVLAVRADRSAAPLVANFRAALDDFSPFVSARATEGLDLA